MTDIREPSPTSAVCSETFDWDSGSESLSGMVNPPNRASPYECNFGQPINLLSSAVFEFTNSTYCMRVYRRDADDAVTEDTDPVRLDFKGMLMSGSEPGFPESPEVSLEWQKVNGSAAKLRFEWINFSGEVGLVGGAVMCLVFRARNATRDVDAVFEPAAVIRRLAAKIGEDQGVGPNWFTDAAKGYIQGSFQRKEVASLSNLRIWAPEPRYMLAMKCLSARWDTNDRDDVLFLLRHLGVSEPAEVFEIIESYYPKRQIPPKTQFLIEEILE